MRYIGIMEVPMNRMVECICGQCAEHPGQFKGYVQCEDCGFYGHEKDEFPDGSEICSGCLEARDRRAAEAARDQRADDWNRGGRQ
jgi:hypothetical protein